MRVRETLDTVLTAAMAVGALTVATLWIRREMLAPPVRPAEATRTEIRTTALRRSVTSSRQTSASSSVICPSRGVTRTRCRRRWLPSAPRSRADSGRFMTRSLCIRRS